MIREFEGKLWAVYSEVGVLTMATTNEYADLKPLGKPKQDFEYRGLHPKKKATNSS